MISYTKICIVTFCLLHYVTLALHYVTLQSWSVSRTNHTMLNATHWHQTGIMLGATTTTGIITGIKKIFFEPKKSHPEINLSG